MFIALLIMAPGALASTLDFSSGTLTYTGAPTISHIVTFGEPSAGSVEVRTYDSDLITAVPGNCTATANSGGPSSDYTCTGVTSLVANAGNMGDTLTAAGDTFGGTTPAVPPILDIPATLNGGTGDDFLTAGTAGATLNGGAGNDSLYGGPGNDTLNGGSGNDTLVGDVTSGAYSGACTSSGSNHDVLNGGDGTDSLYPSSGPNQVSGGNGVDQVIYYDNCGAFNGSTFDVVATPVNVTLDGQPDSGYAGNNSSIATDVENVSVTDNYTCPTSGGGFACPYGAATLTGSSGPNSLSGGSGNDTITGGAGPDFMSGNAGNNTMNAVDGYPDRVDCGGAGTANVDQLDSVFSCTTVNTTQLTNTGLVNSPPAVSWVQPGENGKLSASRPTTLQVTASAGDHAITQVIFTVGERIVCIVKTAPYACSYQPMGTDVGKNTMVAMAVDDQNISGTALRTVFVSQFKPKKLTATTKPKRRKHGPFSFTTTGKLMLPTGVTPANGCTGKVSVTFKSGRKTVSSKVARLKRSCRYGSRTKLSFKGKAPKSLKVTVTFSGNPTLTKSSAKSQKVRLR
ncbi:MAG: calcium-binding protein [Solirubrobacteraceae bacterium]